MIWIGNDIYPVTIVQDRYGGVYSKAKWIAMPCDEDEFPPEANADDVTAGEFWDGDVVAGKGNTPNEAYQDLLLKLAAQDQKGAKIGRVR